MATGTQVGTQPGTALISVPGPLFEFADGLWDAEVGSDLVDEALMRAFATGRRGNAPKGYGMHILATEEMVGQLRELARLVSNPGELTDLEKEVLDTMDTNLKAGSRRFLNRTERVKYAAPPKPKPEDTSDEAEGESETGQTESDQLSDELKASLEEAGISAEDAEELAKEGSDSEEPSTEGGDTTAAEKADEAPESEGEADTTATDPESGEEGSEPESEEGDGADEQDATEGEQEK